MSELKVDMVSIAFDEIVWGIDHKGKETIVTDNMVIVSTGESIHSISIYNSEDNPFVAVSRIIPPGSQEKTYRRTYAYDEIDELKASLKELRILP